MGFNALTNKGEGVGEAKHNIPKKKLGEFPGIQAIRQLDQALLTIRLREKKKTKWQKSNVNVKIQTKKKKKKKNRKGDLLY